MAPPMPVSKSEKIRARLGHPIIDSDGHTVELTPVFLDYLKQAGGPTIVDRYVKATAARGTNRWHDMSESERRRHWTRCPPWWARPTRTLDRATASLPRLLHERMDELGLDFTVLYPTEGMGGPPVFRDEELRRVSCRALNTFHADIYRECADRMTPAAVVPFENPQEAIDEMEHAVGELGLKVIVFTHQRRPIPRAQGGPPELARYAYRLDTFGLDSEHDYDPVWAKCVELGAVPTSHAGSQGIGTRQSISNYAYNHMGHFAAANDAICKSLFMGGVTRRFPGIRLGFLECGVGWACLLYADLVGHWEKRGPKGIRNLNPDNLDREELLRLVDEYGSDRVRERLEEIRKFFDGTDASAIGNYRSAHELRHPDVLDDWARCEIDEARQIRDLFVPHFYFGCEADDPTVAWAFDTRINPFGARLNAMMSSDLGHWDVADMREVVPEAYELLERGILDEDDFRDFAFTNAARFYTEMNPGFFAGTVCEDAVSRVASLPPGV